MRTHYQNLRLLLSDPEKGWQKLHNQPLNLKNLLLTLLLPISLFLALANVFSVYFADATPLAMLYVLVMYTALPFIVIFSVSAIAGFFAANYKGKNNFAAAVQVITYSMAPIIILYAVGVIISAGSPILGGVFTFIIAFFLGLGLATYLLYDGFGIRLQIPEARHGWFLVLMFIILTMLSVFATFALNTLVTKNLDSGFWL